MKNLRKILLVSLLMLAVGATVTRRAEAFVLTEFAYQLPVLNSQPLGMTGTGNGLASFPNSFLDLLQVGGARLAFFADLPIIKPGIAGDVLWQLDYDIGRTPFTSGYLNSSFAATALYRPIPFFQVGIALGPNYQNFQSPLSVTTTGWGLFAEASAGFVLGAGKGFLIEAAYQFRTALASIHYGVLRLGFVF